MKEKLQNLVMQETLRPRNVLFMLLSSQHVVPMEPALVATEGKM